MILDAATMMYQKKYNKFSKSDKRKLKEELDDDFDDFYNDLLDQIYDVNDMTYADDIENKRIDEMNWYENIFLRT